VGTRCGRILIWVSGSGYHGGLHELTAYNSSETEMLRSGSLVY
jgi:hypothetical protein